MNKEEIINELIDLRAQKETIQNRITELESMLTTVSAADSFSKLNEAIDKIFNLLKPETNVVLLSECYGDRADCFSGYLGGECEFPTNHFYVEGSYENVWCNTPSREELTDDYFNALEGLCAVLHETNRNYTIVPDIEELYGDDEAINEYWSGYVALTRDHKVVNFICRDDNLMEGGDNWTPTPTYDFYKSYEENQEMAKKNLYKPMPIIYKEEED